jgi:hypothetical protein
VLPLGAFNRHRRTGRIGAIVKLLVNPGSIDFDDGEPFSRI